MTYVQVWSKSDQRQLRKTLHNQTDKPTDTTKIIVTWPWTNRQNCQHCIKTCANELNDMKLRYFIVQNQQRQYDMIVLNTKCLNVDCAYKHHFSRNNTAALTLGVNSQDTRKQLCTVYIPCTSTVSAVLTYKRWPDTKLARFWHHAAHLNGCLSHARFSASDARYAN